MLATSLIVVSWESQFEAAISGRSGNTVAAYRRDIGGFARWYAQVNRQAFDPALLTSIDIRDYRRHSLEVEQVKPSTWNRRRSSLAVFCQWAFESGFVNYNPFQGVDAAEQVELPPRWLEVSQLKKVIRQVERQVNAARSDAEKSQALRDQALVALMAYAGLRECEAVALDLGDVQIGERSGRVIVRLGKGGKRREVPLNLECRRSVAMWLDVRGNAPGALFSGRSGERISTRLVQRCVAEIGRLSGVQLSPHDLRHTFAKRMLDEGAPLTVVSKLLGHSRLETTARYVQPGWADYESAVERI